jgi:hypothetical protein
MLSYLTPIQRFDQAAPMPQFTGSLEGFAVALLFHISVYLVCLDLL